MKRTSWIALLSCCLLTIVAITGVAQTDDGPYIIVDPSATPWGNVFRTLQGALAFINDQPNVEEMAGTTIILYPGVHDVGTVSPLGVLPTGIDINVPGLRLVSRDGANRTIIQATKASLMLDTTPMTNVLAITAPGVVIEDVTIQTIVPVNGIGVGARNCTLRNVTVQGFAGFQGIEVQPGGDNLLIDAVKCVGGSNGIRAGFAGAVYDLTVKDSTARSCFLNGIFLVDAHRTIISSSALSGNMGNGLNVGILSRDINVANCEINENGGAGIAVFPAFGLTVTGCSFAGNAGFSISLAGTSEVLISSCAFQTGGSAVLVGPGCADIRVLGNTMLKETSGPFPTPAINIGAATNCRIENNEITGYASAINFAAGAGPSDVVIAQNTISDTLGNGIQILASGGGNEIRGNILLGCGGNGISIAAATSDTYSQNVVTACTLSGIAVTDPTPIANLKITGNAVSESGQDGIQIDALRAGAGISNLTIADNEIRDNDDRGITLNQLAATSLPFLGLRIENNLIAGNEQQGLWFANAPGCVITGNTITRNLNQGIFGTHSAAETRILQNSVYDNAGGGIEINWIGPGNLVIEENLLVGNNGFAVSLTGAVPAPIPPGPLPYPYGMSLASNWWGAPTGPAGFFGGTGNALLGVPAASINAVAPVLTAPTIASASTKAQIIEYAQVSVIPSFASSKVSVNRLDTSGVRIVFSEVEPRASGLVSTGRFTDYALEEALPKPSGDVVGAVAVLLSGFDTGVAEVALAFDSSVIAGRSPDELQILALEDATWVFDEDAGTWVLDGGTWTPLVSCPVPGANLISVEIPVPDLRGKYIALALVLPIGSTE